MFFDKKIIKKIWIASLLCSLLTSCSHTIYYYATKDYYGILKRDKLTFFHSGNILDIDTDHLYRVYNENNGLNNINVDSLVSFLNEEIKKKGEGPFYSFEEKVKVNLIENGIIYEHSAPIQIDTFKLDVGVYQNNKKLPFPKYFINSNAAFNQIGAPLKYFKNNFALQYVKDSLFLYSDQEIERIYIFHLYPTIYNPSDNFEKVLDTASYSNPIILGISATSGVPVYAATSKTLYEDNHFIESMNCYNWIKIKGVSRKKLELLLR